MRILSVPDSRDTMFVVPWHKDCAPLSTPQRYKLIIGYINLLSAVELQGRITGGDSIALELMIRDDCIIRRASIEKAKRIVDFENKVGVKVWDKLINDYTSRTVVINIGNSRIELVPHSKTSQVVDIRLPKGKLTVKRQELEKVFKERFGVSYRDTIMRALVDNMGRSGYAPLGKVMVGEYYIESIRYDHKQKVYVIHMERDKEAKGYNVRIIKIKAGNVKYIVYPRLGYEHGKWIGYKAKNKYYLITSAVKSPEIKTYCLEHDVLPMPISPSSTHPDYEIVEAKARHLGLFMMLAVRDETGASAIYASFYPNAPKLNVNIPIVLYAPQDRSTPYKNEIEYVSVDIVGLPPDEKYLICQDED